MTLSKKHVVILGAGRSGRSAALLALREGAHVSVWDTADPDMFKHLPAGVEIHPHATLADGARVHSDILVVSPGINTFGSFVAAFSTHAGEVIGEVELAARHYRGRIVAVTGTNGKTTTIELISRILAKAGQGGTACGNYGMPFAEVVMLPEPPPAVALELSSFQLETIRSLSPDVAVWLNFAADHMDRYLSVADYFRAKLRIFENQTPDHAAVIRAGEPLPALAATKTTFSITDSSAAWFSDGKLIYRHGRTVLDLSRDTSLRGYHNEENAMAALAACEAVGVPLVTMIEALHGYAPPPHRCELIRTLDGVEYLNDSKATNLHALESALRSQNRPVILIAGGKEKGLDYHPLLPLLREKVLACVTFGQIGTHLAEVFSEAVTTTAVENLTEAVSQARSLAPRGSSILLSPGTSSFDQFEGYEERGEAFRSLVNQLR